jgi:hypothetical protein
MCDVLDVYVLTVSAIPPVGDRGIVVSVVGTEDVGPHLMTFHGDPYEFESDQVRFGFRFRFIYCTKMLTWSRVSVQNT